MSRGLMDFVQNTKQTMDVESEGGKKNAWAGDGNIQTVAG